MNPEVLNELLQNHLPELAVAGALAWGAGLRLYLVVFMFGLAGAMGWWDLPGHLDILQHPLVIGAAGLMSIVEFFGDKLPFLDTVWDAAHTVIRIPAGAALAGAVFGDSGAAITLAAALLGGSVTAATHLGKSGTRAAANTSPEPLSNAVLSITEDVAVVGGTILAVTHPAVFLVLLLVFLICLFFLLRLVIRGWKRLRESRRNTGLMKRVRERFGLLS
ncbi:MAG: DUF4126 domain-containing protein [Burkholderiaceae bacterium]